MSYGEDQHRFCVHDTTFRHASAKNIEESPPLPAADWPERLRQGATNSTRQVMLAMVQVAVWRDQ